MCIFTVVYTLSSDSKMIDDINETLLIYTHAVFRCFLRCTFYTPLAHDLFQKCSTEKWCTRCEVISFFWLQASSTFQKSRELLSGYALVILSVFNRDEVHMLIANENLK